MSRTTKLFVAVAAGFVAGVLLAPKSGKETRQELKTRALEAKEFTNKKSRQAKNAARDAGMFKNKLRNHADRLAVEGKRTADRIQKDVKKP